VELLRFYALSRLLEALKDFTHRGLKPVATAIFASAHAPPTIRFQSLAGPPLQTHLLKVNTNTQVYLLKYTELLFIIARS